MRVAQYALLEANAKVSGRGQISRPHPPKKLLTNLDGYSNISLCPPRGADLQNLVEIDSAVMNLRVHA